jgi:hypothetical protein
VDNNTPTTGTDLCYPALTPFKFKGNIVKPPAFVQMSADEAAPYLAAQVIGEDAALPPEHDLAFRDAGRLEAGRLEAERLEAERLEAEQLVVGDREAERLETAAATATAAVDFKTTTPDTTPPTVAANPAAGVPVAGKATKPKPGK